MRDLKNLFFVVSDMDGTIANDEARQHYLENQPRDWDGFFAACEQDTPIQPVITVLHGLTPAYMGCLIEIWTGRSEKYRTETERWLERHRVLYSRLRMRADGDYRPDTVVKGEWLAEYSKLPDLVLDDRNKSVAFWRSLGIVTLQVANHDY